MRSEKEKRKMKDEREWCAKGEQEKKRSRFEFNLRDEF